MLLLFDFLEGETYKYEQNIENSLEMYLVNKQKSETEANDLLKLKFKLYWKSKIY